MTQAKLRVKPFTKEEFEAALPIHKQTNEPMWTHSQLIDGEHVYFIPVTGTNKRIVIRSSVGANGVSADCGKDSIRLWVEYYYKKAGKWIALGKLDRWTTRVTGWERRVTAKLRELWKLAISDSKGRTHTSGANESNQIKKSNEGSKDQDSLVPLGGGEKAETASAELASSPSDTSDQVEDSPPPKFVLPLGDEVAEPVIDELEEIDEGEPVERDRNDIRLNEFQQAVIDAEAKGPTVIEAAPGSGKTRTLENLVASLIESGADPTRIGVFTFSNSAAAEARHRIALTLWPEISERALDFLTEPHEHKGHFPDSWIDQEPARRMLIDWTCTIHALSFRLLKELTGKKLKVLASGQDKWDADGLIKDSLKEFDWEESLDSVQYYIDWAIRELVIPAKAAGFFKQVLAGTDVSWRSEHLAEIYRRFYDFCKSRKLVGFDGMQARVRWLLENDPSFLKKAQNRFDYIIVDEAQDTSGQQAEVLWTLIEKSKNVVFFADVDQSMYEFRQAKPSVVRQDFEAAWPNVQRFNLPINYRSTKAIIEAASKLIKHNYEGPDDPYLKPFDSRPDAEDGEPLTFVYEPEFAELAKQVANIVAESPQDWFILSRTRAECAAIHLELIRQGVPAVNKSGGILFGAPHVRKVLAYARLACDYGNARDDLEILSEIANVASVEFKAPFTRRRHRDGCRNDKGWIDCGCPVIAEGGEDYSHTRFYGQAAIKYAGGWDGVLHQRYETNRGGYPTTRAKGAEDLVRFVQRVEKLKDDAGACLNMIISDCVLPWLAVEYNVDGDDPAENGKGEDLGLLLSMVKDGQTMTEYLDEVESLTSESEKGGDGNSVTLGTVHWSKGRESKSVIVNLTRCPIVPPVQKPGKLPMGKPPTIEEERRLAYVAVTRAKERCVVVAAGEWNGQGVEESPFVGELGLQGCWTEDEAFGPLDDEGAGITGEEIDPADWPNLDDLLENLSMQDVRRFFADYADHPVAIAWTEMPMEATIEDYKAVAREMMAGIEQKLEEYKESLESELEGE